MQPRKSGQIVQIEIYGNLNEYENLGIRFLKFFDAGIIQTVQTYKYDIMKTETDRATRQMMQIF
ncbi:hypothetical protein SS50377_25530 [Spironucleus salmonicida]|uniref:Uncharacterized protein n=1 Tax=Spironucleus salmonicida TaxID=348837 RepID=V6LL36_9EUKA|nr:hypothetical protein SS50377_25530 [Spironucleus salmonicida]|eukprot:EST45078.1 Hypothetical protein SS50377_15098 [Spironucleus salmonicida]